MRILLAVLISTSLTLAARAEEAPKKEPQSAAARLSGSFMTWFKHVKEGLAESSVGSYRQKAHITAAAAVRGAGQESVDPTAPVWKSAADGKKSKALRAQREELTAAVDDVLAGKTEEARAKLEAFDKAHPDSLLAADVKEMRAKLDDAAAASDDELARADKVKARADAVKKDAAAAPK